MRQLYVRRGSRMTQAQARAYECLGDYCFDPEQPEHVARLQIGERPLLVEIGFGNGDVLAQFAEQHPDWSCVGIEVFRPGIGSLIRQCQQNELTNVNIAESDGLTVLEALPDSSIKLMFVLFPDPWPKRRHHRRRLVNPEFAEVASAKIEWSGTLHLATDWGDYANQIESILAASPVFEGGVTERPDMFPKTRFEQRGETLGHNVCYFEYTRIK